MHALRWTVRFLVVCGCIPPSSWTSSLKKLLYNSYTLLACLLVYGLMLTQIFDIIFNVENIDDICDNLNMTVAIVVSACKITMFVIRRKGILSLFETLQEEPFLTVNEEEKKIQTRYSNIIERSAIAYMCLVKFSAILIYGRSYYTGYKIRKLTFRAWLPYDYSGLLPYTFTYAFQITSSIFCSIINVGCDSLFGGMLLHIYCQFEIFEERLKNMHRGKGCTTRQCANHHYHIYRFAKMVNEEFKVIMLFQFCASTIVVCFNLYQMTHLTMIPKLIETAFYTACVLVEILYYCWYSNEVKLKSLEVPGMIFRSNWATWDSEAKKILLMIMKRAAEPIEFTTICFLSLNLDSFMALLKTSYSVFSVMQQKQN